MGLCYFAAAPCLGLMVLATACAGPPGPRSLYPIGGDQFSLIDPGPPAPEAPPLACQGPRSRWFECLFEDLRLRLDRAGVTGAVAIVDREAGVQMDIHGPADGPPLTPDARFAVGSISKTVLALTTLSLVEEQTLDLKAPISRYLPQLTAAPVGAATLHQLLSHTAGLPPGLPHTLPCASLRSLAELPSHLEAVALFTAPGTVHSYSNLGYGLIAAVIERVTAAPFEEVVRTRVLWPAGMTTATYDADAPGPKVLGGRGARPMCRVDLPSGGLWASIRDVTQLLQVLRAGGRPLVRPESLQAMQAAQAPTGTGEHDGYGYGVIRTQVGREPLLLHTGALPHFAGLWALFPQQQFGVVVLVNTNKIPMGTMLRAGQLFVGVPAASPSSARPPQQWSRYVGHYEDERGRLGTVAVVLEAGRLQIRFVGQEPAEGLPPRVTFLPPSGEHAQFVVTPLGVAQRTSE